jgi:hypothetical protein
MWHESVPLSPYSLAKRPFLHQLHDQTHSLNKNKVQYLETRHIKNLVNPQHKHSHSRSLNNQREQNLTLWPILVTSEIQQLPFNVRLS